MTVENAAAAAAIPWASEVFDRQEQIRSFVLHFLQSNNVAVNEYKGGAITANLPPTLAESLQVPTCLQLCFAPELNGICGEFLTFGHPLLDRMLALAGTRGLTTSLLFTSSLDSEFLHLAVTNDPWAEAPADAPRTYKLLCTAIRRIHFTNARCRTMKRRILHQPQVLFNFRVSYASDEKREFMVPVLIDPVTETVDTLIAVDDAVSFSLPVWDKQKRAPKKTKPLAADLPKSPINIDTLVRTGQEQLPGDPYTLLRLYRKAVYYLEEKMATELASFSAEARGRLEREVARIEEYYAGLARETLDPLRKVFRRMASLSVRTQLARSYEAQNRYSAQLYEMKQEAADLEQQYGQELDRLAEEKDRRISEQSAKYQPQVEIHLANVAALRVPRLEFTCRLSGSVRRELTFFYDVLREQVVDLECEACHQPMHEVMLCACGDVVCTECGGTCSCGKPVCTSCATRSCHVCGRLICESCIPSCPINCMQHLELAVCADCKGTECSTCMGMVGSAVTGDVW